MNSKKNKEIMQDIRNSFDEKTKYMVMTWSSNCEIHGGGSPEVTRIFISLHHEFHSDKNSTNERCD